MSHKFAVSVLILILNAVPASALELTIPEHDQRRLRIELEAAPPTMRSDFDKYVEELAAAAQRETASPAARNDAKKEQQAKSLNPVVLFRW